MSMPRNLVLVRHGQSEGNVATDAAKNGNIQHYTDNFVNTPGHQWRLTEKGRLQAKAIGSWLRSELRADDYDRAMVSPFVRTRETAAYLGLNQQWIMNRALRERDWGDIGSVPRTEFETLDKYADNFHQRQIDPLYWCPVNGESIAHVAENRVRNVLSTLHRENSMEDVIAVSHGEMMWAFRMVLGYWTDEEFVRRDEDKSQKIHNCQAIHFTRENPYYPTQIAGRISWVRMIRPIINDDGSSTIEVGEWEEIRKPSLSDEELLTSIANVPYLIQ